LTNATFRKEEILKYRGNEEKTVATVAKTEVDNSGNEDLQNSSEYKEGENDNLLFTSPENLKFVTFHAGFAYEDFVQGLKPKLEASTLQFELKNGGFYDICEQAAKLAGFNSLQDCLDSEKSDRKDFFQLAMDENNFAYILIDEINRGNVSKIFGELISLIEDTKRLGAKDELIITLPSGQKFGVPANLKIIGTMNTADKSLAHLDIALRRRFHFEACYPDSSKIQDDLKKRFEALNVAITKAKNKEYQIGHAFFMSEKPLDEDQLKEVMDYKVIPLMMEYFGKGDKVKELMDASGFMVDKPHEVTDIPKFDRLTEITPAP
jgi:5-methylcytosine-specific restriction protein B